MRFFWNTKFYHPKKFELKRIKKEKQFLGCTFRRPIFPPCKGSGPMWAYSQIIMPQIGFKNYQQDTQCIHIGCSDNEKWEEKLEAKGENRRRPSKYLQLSFSKDQQSSYPRSHDSSVTSDFISTMTGVRRENWNQGQT